VQRLGLQAAVLYTVAHLKWLAECRRFLQAVAPPAPEPALEAHGAVSNLG
jgi:hypothetical protein